jgi:hypothetical protein
MAQPINGTLYVDAYVPTGNPGEYTFTNGLYNNQNDTGNGAYDIVPGFVIYVAPTSINTGVMIGGVSNRYILTSVEVVDTIKVSGTMLWDNKDAEVDLPTNGIFAIIAQTTANLKLAVPPVDNIYNDLTPGTTLATMLSDVVNIMDKIGGSTVRFKSEVVPVSNNGQKEFTLQFAPINTEVIFLTVNGLKYAYGVANDFVINGTALSWMDHSLVLELQDVISVSYTY